MKPPARTALARTCLCFRPLPPCRHFSATSVTARKKGGRPAPAAPAAPAPVSRGAQKHAHATSHSAPNTYQHFRLLVQRHFQAIVRQLQQALDKDPDALRPFALSGAAELHICAKNFSKAIETSFGLAVVGTTSRAENPLFWGMRHGFVRGNAGGLTRELTYAFRSFAGQSKYNSPLLKLPSGAEVADFRFPLEWYPATRAMHRTVHLHVGPTNSGKTYNALKALENARTGVYAGPLRLLAHEVYTRLTAKGKKCALLTGEEQRIPANFQFMMASCTVEMTPLNDPLDVAVIDEIQMIADEERGFAWTQAFLGVQAREVHLCGEERTVDLIQRLCARLGDKCIVHRYERLSPLRTMRRGLDNNLGNLEKGDAVVSFSRVDLHALKAGIEKQTGKRCAVVYGSLPPETRAEQAGLFNDPDNEYDYIVASDAIGMGLNLEIRRVVFDSVSKFDGVSHRFLAIPEIRQIGGRAGRFRSAAQDIRQDATAPPSPPAPIDRASRPPGLVTCLDNGDLDRITKAFEEEPPAIKAAGLLPPASVIEKLHSFFPPGTPLSHVILKIREMTRVSDEFFLCNVDNWIEVADAIEHFQMPIYDRITLLNAPTYRETADMIKVFAKCISELKGGHVLEIKELDLEVLDMDPRDAARPREFLDRLERLHKSITLYLWLSYRYEGVFTSQPLAFEIKALAEAKISEQLDSIDYRPERRAATARLIREAMKKREEAETQILPDLAQGGTGGVAAGVAHMLEASPEGGSEPLTEPSVT